jgi:calcineurin-like phosphoesterase family protein
MTFLHSLDPEAPKNFFTSDLHYGHKNIITFCKRPFETVDEMDQGLIDNHNAVVRPRDTTYFLGDISFYESFDKTAEIINQLNGNKVLIYGNHDWKFRKDYPKLFQSCWDYFELRRGKSMIVMSHYPMLQWNKGHHGSIMLHGHSHGMVNPENAGRNRYDVGVDSNNYRPVDVATILANIELAKTKTE